MSADKFLDKIGRGLGTKVEKVTKGVLSTNLAKTYIIEIKVSVVMDVTYSYTARDVPGGDWWTTGHFPWNWSYPSRTIEAADITLASQKVMLPIGDKASNTNILNALRDVSLEAIAQVAKNKTAFMDGLMQAVDDDLTTYDLQNPQDWKIRKVTTWDSQPKPK